MLSISFSGDGYCLNLKWLMPVPVIFLFRNFCLFALLYLFLRPAKAADGNNHNDETYNDKYRQSEACADENCITHSLPVIDIFD